SDEEPKGLLQEECQPRKPGIGARPVETQPLLLPPGAMVPEFRADTDASPIAYCSLHASEPLPIALPFAAPRRKEEAFVPFPLAAEKRAVETLWLRPDRITNLSVPRSPEAIIPTGCKPPKAKQSIEPIIASQVPVPSAPVFVDDRWMQIRLEGRTPIRMTPRDRHIEIWQGIGPARFGPPRIAMVSLDLAPVAPGAAIETLSAEPEV